VGSVSDVSVKNEIDVIRDFVGRFARARIAYMLTGSFAMNYYALPRMTRDIDVVVELDAQDVGRVVDLFQPDYYVAHESVARAVARQSVFNLIHQETVIKVDCIVRKSSEYRRVEFERRAQVSINDFSTWIVSKEDLIISKLEWAKETRSEQQFRDVRNLLATGYDADYMERWTQRLGLDELWREFSDE
jgi:hypothetical protein